MYRKCIMILESKIKKLQKICDIARPQKVDHNKVRDHCTWQAFPFDGLSPH